MHILSISEDILLYVCGLGILQGIFLAFLIQFHPKSDHSVNIFLALFIFCNSILVTMPIILRTIYWQNSFFVQPIPLAIGPLLYLYLRSFKEKITWRKALPHFIPFLLFFYPVWWSIDVMAKRYPDAKTLPPEVLLHPRTMVLMYVRVFHLLAYYFVARHTLRSYQRSIQQLFSQTSKISLDWARFLVNGYLVLFTCFAIVFTMMFRYPEYFNLLLLINMSFATIYIYAVTVKGVTQPSIWQIQSGTKKEVLQQQIQEAEVPRPTRAGLNEDKMDAIVKKITALMEDEKLYHEAELTLRQLSKTTFNTVFKKFTGLTPTEYREQHKPVFAEG